MKKLLLTSAALYLLASASAFAQFDLNVNLGGGVEQLTPAVIIPSPAVVNYAGYDPYHRDHDARYWRERREHERWEHEEHARREHERYDHRDHHDQHDHHEYRDNHHAGEHHNPVTHGNNKPEHK